MNNPPEYQEIAKEIITNSIKKAIFIDDKASLPFSKESISDEFCSKLFQSFYKNNSVLDFLPYSDGDNATKKILSGRNDLIILDWELSEKTPKYNDTLEIIEGIISNESPHFLCVYTNEKSSVFHDILIKIKAHLSTYRVQLEYEFAELLEFIDEVGLEFEEFREKFDELIRDYLLISLSEEKPKRKEINRELRIFFW